MTRRITAAALVVLFAGAFAALPVAPASAAGFRKTETISRTTLNADGTSTVLDTRTVSVSVAQTSDLRGRQQIDVSWSGAHPTGGLVSDPNSTEASRQEYPMVILECRGIDANSAPAGQRLDPTTCWTQTPDERYQDSFDQDNQFPEWRLDRYETVADRAAKVNPPPASLNCDDGSVVSRFVPFVAADKTVYPWGPNGACGIPPEGSLNEDSAAPPANATYAPTGTDGTGTASFDIWTAQENESLGCSITVPCSLVMVPIMGISCDPAAAGLPAEDRPPADVVDVAAAECEKTGRYAPGQQFSSDVRFGPGDTSVVGALWWSASNWRNRITVPLGFAPAANVCDVVDNRVPVDIYGSELMDQAAILWQAKFCQDPRLFKFEHVSTGEPQAKSALADGSISSALISDPPTGGWTVPTVNAPVSVTGFAISYAVDDANGHAYAHLKLSPRLLAKLLSESYWGQTGLQQDYLRLPASNKFAKMAKNPQDITRDPEFIKLNPGIGPTIQSQAASTLLALSGDSDVMFALTSYINADPDARAFLNGVTDPWGMTVNPTYKGIKLPLSAWPLEDTFLSPDITLQDCLLNDKHQLVPVPILPLIAAPMATLAGIAKAMQFAIANSQTSCVPLQDVITNEIFGGTLKPLGREPAGRRFMLGLTAVGDSTLYGLHSAALESSPGHYVDADRRVHARGNRYRPREHDDAHVAAVVREAAHRGGGLPRDDGGLRRDSDPRSGRDDGRAPRSVPPVLRRGRAETRAGHRSAAARISPDDGRERTRCSGLLYAGRRHVRRRTNRSDRTDELLVVRLVRLVRKRERERQRTGYHSAITGDRLVRQADPGADPVAVHPAGRHAAEDHGRGLALGVLDAPDHGPGQRGGDDHRDRHPHDRVDERGVEPGQPDATSGRER